MFQNGVNRKRDSKSLDACVCIEVLQGTNGTGLVTVFLGLFHQLGILESKAGMILFFNYR